MHEIKAIVRPDRLESVLDALHEIPDIPGITVSTIQGFGRREPPRAEGAIEYGHVTMTKIEVVVVEPIVSQAVEKIRRAAATGHAGDGVIFVTVVHQAMRIRSGEEGLDAS